MTAPILLAEHLTKRYGALLAVDDLNLEVQPGEIFGFLGPNGAGKTTAINILCGLLPPDSGRVTLHGTALDHGGDAQARIGVCPQEIVLWGSLTCLEQLQFIGEMYGLPGRTALSRGRKLLEELELSEKGPRLARTLSGGMQRRLNLAMALVHDPEVVILDEPEAGLDPQSRLKVREYIRSLRQNKTVILTTHNMDEADRLADRVAIIDHGRLLVIGTPETLKQQAGIGDVLELGLGASNASLAGEACTALQAALAKHQPSAPAASPRIERVNGSLIIRAPNLVTLLPLILETLHASGLEPGEIRLRQNTLEDAFIQLTGRRLRE